MVHDAEDGAAGAGLGVGCGVDEARDAGVEDGAGTHGAGFEGDVESAASVAVIFVDQAIVFEGAAGLAEGDDLGVGGGVVVAEDTVLAMGDDLALVDDDSADGDFAGGFGGAASAMAAWRKERSSMLLAPLADLGVGFGAEEAGDLLGQCMKRRTTKS